MILAWIWCFYLASLVGIIEGFSFENVLKPKKKKKSQANQHITFPMSPLDVFDPAISIFLSSQTQFQTIWRALRLMHNDSRRLSRLPLSLLPLFSRACSPDYQAAALVSASLPNRALWRQPHTAHLRIDPMLLLLPLLLLLTAGASRADGFATTVLFQF